MKKYILIIMSLGILVFICGCGKSWKVATQSFDRSKQVEDSVVSGLFTKAWGLNRAVITESRAKLVAKAKLELSQQANDGSVSTTQAAGVIESLDEELGKDEVVTSQNFAYLSLLMSLYERAGSLEGNVDYYLASNKPIWLALSDEASDTVQDVLAELNKWKPLIGPLVDIVPDLFKKDLNTEE